MMRKFIALLVSPVFIVGVFFWSAVIWWDTAKDWVLEIREWRKK